MLLLSNEDIIPLIDMQDALSALEEAFKAYCRGKVVNIPWSIMSVPGKQEGQRYQMFELRAAMPDLGVSAIRVISSVNDLSAGGGGYVPASRDKRVDKVLLFDLQTGQLLAVLAGRHIQVLRVGATSALGVKYLAREDSETLGMFGSSGQAETQLEATALVRPLKRALIYSRNPENRESFARSVQAKYPFPVEPVATPEALVEQSDIITAATSSRRPVFDGSQVRPGTHVNTLTVAQVDDAVLQRSSIFATTREPIMEHLAQGVHRVFQAEAAYHRHWDRIQELEKVMLGQAPGRQSRDEITLFYGTGAGLQFAALGHLVLQRARERGVGRDLPDEWFLGE